MSNSTQNATLTFSLPFKKPTNWPIFLTVAVSIATICAQFTVVQGGLLNWSYDSGVYLGAAIHTLHGVLPYRDFTFVQPPGIIYMMLPPALLQWLIGGSASLGLARLMCMIIMVVNVGYVTYLLRRWGRTAQVVAGLALALWIGTIGLDWAIMMDPYLLLFTAMSIEYLIRSTESEDFASKNLRLSGIFLGIAMLMKLWAAFPMIPILLVALTWHRRKGLSLLWNATMTFFVASLPFILGAPVKFFQFNVVVQFTRSLHPISSTEINDRLNAFGNFLVYPIGHIGNAGTIFIVTLALVGFLLSIVKKSVEQAFLIVLVMGLILCLYSLVQTTLMPPYYLYFGTLFGVCLLGVTAEVLRRGISRYLKALGIGRTGLVVLIAIGLLAGTWYLQQNVAGISAYNLTELNHNASLGTLNFFKVIPNGACVQTNDPYILVYSGLIDSNVPGCPAELDPYGIWLFKAPHSVDVNGTPESALVAQEWQQFLSKSQYYVESPGLRYLLPNDSFLRAWFSHHFIEISRTDHLIIYENNSLMKTGN